MRKYSDSVVSKAIYVAETDKTQKVYYIARDLITNILILDKFLLNIILQIFFLKKIYNS